jgi:hypothetical protein
MLGSQGYSDIKEGAEVTIKDGTGAIISMGRLQTGRTEGEAEVDVRRSAYGNSNDAVSDPVTRCTFGFVAPDVPKVKFYKIEVGHRQGPAFSYKELENSGWAPALALGRT